MKTKHIELNNHEIVLQATKYCKHFNRKQYNRGYTVGYRDYHMHHDFGTACNKLTHSFCKGYLHAWNTCLRADGIAPIMRLVEAW